MISKHQRLAALTTRRNQGLIGVEQFQIERQQIVDEPDGAPEVARKTSGPRP